MDKFDFVMGFRKQIHQKVLNACNKNALADAYSLWADRYDSDIINRTGYVAPLFAANVLESFESRLEAKVLDAGCGTGIVGEVLLKKGYHNIEGTDYSVEMLEKAQEKGIYKKLFHADLSGPLKIQSDSYDAVISVGTFTFGHVGPEAFNEIARIIKPGGHFCFTVREQAWDKENYRDMMDVIEQCGVWKLKNEIKSDYIQTEGSQCRICICEIS